MFDQARFHTVKQSFTPVEPVRGKPGGPKRNGLS